MSLKIIFSLVPVSVLALLGCNPRQSSKAIYQSCEFKVSVFYPNGGGNTFDMDYYKDKHMPMVAKFLGRNLIRYEIDKGISGRASSDSVPFTVIGHFYINSIEEYNSAIKKNRSAIVGDFQNYTNVQPVIQISKIMAER